MEKVFRFKAGRLVCRHVRDMLESEKFAGRQIEWIESSGWIERTFTIRGLASDIDAVASRLDNYAICLAASR